MFVQVPGEYPVKSAIASEVSMPDITHSSVNRSAGVIESRATLSSKQQAKSIALISVSFFALLIHNCE